MIGPSIIAYFAGSFNRKPELLEYLEQFEADGNHCTSRWLKATTKSTSRRIAASSTTAAMASSSHKKMSTTSQGASWSSSSAALTTSRRGAVAGTQSSGSRLALGRPLVIIGERECAFHSMTTRRVVLRGLERLQQ
jgi:hypothetical protein